MNWNRSSIWYGLHPSGCFCNSGKWPPGHTAHICTKGSTRSLGLQRNMMRVRQSSNTQYLISTTNGTGLNSLCWTGDTKNPRGWNTTLSACITYPVLARFASSRWLSGSFWHTNTKGWVNKSFPVFRVCDAEDGTNPVWVVWGQGRGHTIEAEPD